LNNPWVCRAEALEGRREVLTARHTNEESAGSKWYCQAKETKCGEKGSEQS